MSDEIKNEENEEVEKTTEAPGPVKKSKLGLILGIVVVVLLLGGGAAFYFFGMNSAAADDEDGTKAGEEEEVTETDIYFTGFSSNVVNLAVSDEYDFMYLKYGFDVEVSNQEVITEITSKLPRLTAVVARTMSNRDYTEICTPQGNEMLVREVMREMNKLLETGSVIGIHFHTFVAQ